MLMLVRSTQRRFNTVNLPARKDPAGRPQPPGSLSAADIGDFIRWKCFLIALQNAIGKELIVPWHGSYTVHFYRNLLNSPVWMILLQCRSLAGVKPCRHHLLNSTADHSWWYQSKIHNQRYGISLVPRDDVVSTLLCPAITSDCVRFVDASMQALTMDGWILALFQHGRSQSQL